MLIGARASRNCEVVRNVGAGDHCTLVLVNSSLFSPILRLLSEWCLEVNVRNTFP